MTRTCYYCGQNTRKSKEKKSFFRFPLEKPDLLKQWLQNMKRVGASPSVHQYLCSDHFTDSSFRDKTAKRLNLKPNAMPTIFIAKTLTMGQVLTMGVANLIQHKPADELLRVPSAVASSRAPQPSATPAPHPVHDLPHTSGAPLPSPPPLTQEVRPEASQEGSSGETTCDTGLCSTPARTHKYELRSTPRRLEQSEEKNKSPHFTIGAETPKSSHVRRNVSFQYKNEKNIDLGKKKSTPGTVISDSGISVLNISAPTPDVLSKSSDSLNTCSYCNGTGLASANVSACLNDHTYGDGPQTPARRGKIVQQLKTEKKNLKRTVDLRDRQIKTLRKKVKSLQQVIQDLKSNNHISSQFAEQLEEQFSGAPLEILKRMCKNSKIKKAKLENNSNIDANNVDVNNDAHNDSTVGSDKNYQNLRTGNRNVGRGTRERYSPVIRAFALTLHFHSPRAYEYVRNTFDLALPAVSSIRSWYSTVDAGAGFTQESFDILKEKVEECKRLGKPPPLLAFMLDEVALKAGEEYDASKKQFVGRVDCGGGSICNGNDGPLAKEALVFMVVCMDSHWKLPIAHFETRGLSGEEKANLVSEALIRLHHIGTRVVSLTCDGPSCHISMCNALGATLELSKPVCYFPHPADPSQKVHILLDACHMLKLVRNCLAAQLIMLNSNGEEIKWDYINALHELQEIELMRAGNKIRKKHIEFKKQIMKVNLAAQTLSRSTADSIEFCDKVLNLPQFKGSEATVDFIRHIDKIFDILNSRSPIGRGYKGPMRPPTKEGDTEWEIVLEEEMQYIKGITNIDKKPMYKTNRKTSFLGFYICLQSVRALYKELCFSQNGESPRLQYLLTYKLSQDHIELFFCAIRARGGWNNNPTVLGFRSAYRRLLIRNEIKGGLGNCLNLDNTKILHCTSSSSKIKSTEQKCSDDNFSMDLSDLTSLRRSEPAIQCDQSSAVSISLPLSLPENIELSMFCQNIIAHIAGKCILMAIKHIRCADCIGALAVSPLTKLVEDFPESRAPAAVLQLLEKKSRGFLQIPRDGVFKICLQAEKCIKFIVKTSNKAITAVPHVPLRIRNQVIQDMSSNYDKLFPQLQNHLTECEMGSNHVLRLINEICDAYVKIRMFYFADRAVDEVRTGLRTKLNKLTLFHSQ